MDLNDGRLNTVGNISFATLTSPALGFGRYWFDADALRAKGLEVRGWKGKDTDGARGGPLTLGET